MEGDFDPQTKTLTLDSKGKGPDATPHEMKTVEVHQDHGRRVLTMSMKPDGTDSEYVKLMEISSVGRPEQAIKK